MTYTFEHAIKAITEMWCWTRLVVDCFQYLIRDIKVALLTSNESSKQIGVQWNSDGRSVMNAVLICRQTSIAVWLAGFRLKIFRLIKLHASSFQLTFMPWSNLLHYLKGHCLHWKHSMTNMMIQCSHAGICRALFSISFLSERWISLSFGLTFCCWLGVSRRKLHIPFKGLILMNVSNE